MIFELTVAMLDAKLSDKSDTLVHKRQNISVAVSTQQLMRLAQDWLNVPPWVLMFPKDEWMLTARMIKASAPTLHSVIFHLKSRYLWLISDVCQPDGRQIPPRRDSELWSQSEGFRFQSNPDHTLIQNHQKGYWLSPMPDMNVFLFSFHFFSPTVTVEGFQELSGLMPELRHIKAAHERVPSGLHVPASSAATLMAQLRS